MAAPRPTALMTEVRIFEPEAWKTTAIEGEVFEDPTLAIPWINKRFGQGKVIHVYHWFLEENPYPSKAEYPYIKREFVSKNDEPFFEAAVNQISDSWGSWSQPSPWRGWAVASHELGNHFNADFYNAALGLGDDVVKKASFYTSQPFKTAAARAPWFTLNVSGPAVDESFFAETPPSKDLKWFRGRGGWEVDFSDPYLAFREANRFRGPGVLVCVRFQSLEKDPKNPDHAMTRTFISEDDSDWKENIRSLPKDRWLNPESAVPYLGDFVKKADVELVEPKIRVFVYGMDPADLPPDFKDSNVRGSEVRFSDFSDPAIALKVANELRGYGTTVILTPLYYEEADENNLGKFLRREWSSVDGGPWKEDVVLLDKSQSIGKTLPYLGELVPTNKTASSKMKKKALNQEIDFKTEVILLLSARLLNNYMASYLLRMRKQGLSEAMWQEAIDDAQEASTCGVNSDDDFSAWFYIDHFVEDLVKELMGIKLEENEEEDLKCFMFKVRDQLDYRHPEGYREAVKRWVDSKRVEKKASVSAVETVFDELRELPGLLQTSGGRMNLGFFFRDASQLVRKMALRLNNPQLWILHLGSTHYRFPVSFSKPPKDLSPEQLVDELLKQYPRLKQLVGGYGFTNITAFKSDEIGEYFNLYAGTEDEPYEYVLADIRTPMEWDEENDRNFEATLEWYSAELNSLKEKFKDLTRVQISSKEMNLDIILRVLDNFVSFVIQAAKLRQYGDLYHLSVLLQRSLRTAKTFADNIRTYSFNPKEYRPLSSRKDLSEFEKYDQIRQKQPTQGPTTQKKASVSDLETVVDELNELVGMVETEFGAQQINDLFTSLNSDLERFAFYSENDELWILSGSGFSVPFLAPTIEASYEKAVSHILDNYIKLMEQLGFDKSKLNIEIVDDDRGYDYPRFRIYDDNVRVGQIYKPVSYVQDRWNMFGGPFDKKSELEGIIGRINLTKNLLLGDAGAYKMMQDIRRDFAPPTVVESNPTAINQILTNLASFIEKAAADNRYQDLYHLAIILRRLINFVEKTKLKTHPYFPLTQPEHLSEFEKYDGLRQEYKEKAQPAPSATSTKKASSGDLVNTSQLNTEVWIYNMDPEDAPTDIRKFPDPKLAFEFAKGRTGPGIVVEVRFNFYEKAHDVLKRRGYISVDDGDFDMVELGLDPELPLRGVPWLADYPYRQTIKNAHPNIGKPYSPLQKYDMEKWKATVIKIQKTIRLGFSQEFALKEAAGALSSPEKYDFLMWYNYHLSGVPDKYNVNDEIKAKNRQLRNYYDVN